MTLRSTAIQLDAAQRGDLVGLLENTVVGLVDLANQSKLAHWNVTGPHFAAYHALFDAVADHVRDALDTTAERLTTIGGTVGATVQKVAATTPLAPWAPEVRGDSAVLAALTERCADMANAVRRGVDEAARLGDSATADVLTEVLRQLDKDLWMLEAHAAS
jgi:starvation-inducible DNA-binding protein